MGVQAKWLVGKKIAAVELSSYDNRDHNGLIQQTIESITFEDGSSLSFMAIETEFESEVCPVYIPKKRKGKRCREGESGA